jgi:hypothetical protein
MVRIPFTDICLSSSLLVSTSLGSVQNPNGSVASDYTRFLLAFHHRERPIDHACNGTYDQVGGRLVR